MERGIMKKDKIVIFDWGGVIAEQGEIDEILYQLFLRLKTPLNKEELLKRYKECIKDERYPNINTLNDIKEIEKWYERVKKATQIDVDIKTFEEINAKEFAKHNYHKDLVEYMYSLKERCYIGLLSNLMWISPNTLFTHIDKNKIDYLWLSYKMGTRKPEDKIYELVEKDIPDIKPENIFFIDDQKRNVEMAKKRNWKGCTATGAELDKIKENVEKFLNE